jgi:transposase-like protein
MTQFDDRLSAFQRTIETEGMALLACCFGQPKRDHTKSALLRIMETSARVGTKLPIPVSTGTNAPMTRVSDDAVVQAMVETGGNKAAAARLLGCSSTSIHRGMISARLEGKPGTVGRPAISDQAIAAALATAGGSPSAAARILGCSVHPIYKFKRKADDAGHPDVVTENPNVVALREHGSMRKAAAALGISKSEFHRRVSGLRGA